MTPHAQTPPPLDALAVATPSPIRVGLCESIIELTKPRITRMVAITSGLGFTLGAVPQHWEMGDLVFRALGCVLGTALSASGANALNQWWERDRDAAMPRTCARPLPQERVTPGQALLWGLVFSILGVGVLACVGLAPALVSLVTILIYVLLYTPLKPLTTTNTLVGAIPGALPPLIGWTAAASGNALRGGWNTLDPLLDAGGWSLFALMFVWQIPHFLAIAWMYRDDYALGGYRMLPISDSDGRTTATTILIWSIALVPATLAPALSLHGTLSAVSAVAAVVTGSAYIALCYRLFRTRTIPDARRVFFASIIHLPLLLLVMTCDALTPVAYERVRHFFAT
jgi:protoheme IX farnesyltransferase